jgi:hypothetical protein
MAKASSEEGVETKAYAFIFDGDAANSDHSESLDEAFLSALKEADPNGTTSTRVYRGGLLIASLAYKKSAVRARPPIRRRPGGPIYSESGTTETADKALYATLVGDFVESCLELWNTFDSTKLWDYVANHTLDATIVSGLTAEIAARVDKRLRSYPRYVGAVSPDLGNPLHRQLFIELMFKDAFIQDGTVVVQADYEGEYQGSFIGADQFSPRGMIVMPYEQFETSSPSANLRTGLSARGLVTQMRMQRRMALDIHQKVLLAITDSSSFRDPLEPFEWDLSRLPSAPDEVQVQARKLTDYLLDVEHKGGRSKARFFLETLVIRREDWSFLQAQLVDRLAEVSYDDVRLDEYGIRFTATLPIKGRNGKTATIKTAWIVRPGERASLVTAIPDKKNDDLEKSALTPAVVPVSLTGEERWQAIYALADQAGIAAIAASVPKPLVVEGSVYMEGLCGGAFIVVADARRGFARWLKANEKGRRSNSEGWAIPAPQDDQSAERAEAYATAFSTVLRRNGIACRVEAYLT